MAETTETHETTGNGNRNFQDFLDDLQERVAERRREARENFRQSRVYKDWEKRRLELEEQLDERVTKLLERVGVPTRKEVRALERKVSKLDREYQKLRKQSAAKKSSAPPPSAAPTA